MTSSDRQTAIDCVTVFYEYKRKGKTMKKIGILLSALIMLHGLSVSVQATLMDMNDGTIYDTDTQLSWLKNANSAGLITWDKAVAWAASLNSGGGFAGLTGWRLPATTEPDANCSNQFNPGGRFPLQGNGYSCTGSEMGHLYYVALGNAADSPLANTGPFTNLLAVVYWSGTEYAPVPTKAWYFTFVGGGQFNQYKSVGGYCAWAVRPGVRSLSTPVPAGDSKPDNPGAGRADDSRQKAK
jgi:Protein of unknown function (DUF1566)